MKNLKDYREKELKMYILANILVIVILSNTFVVSEILTSEDSWLVLFIKIVDSTLISSSIYIFAFLADAMFSSGLKMKMVYFLGELPGANVFSSIKTKNNDYRFTSEQVLEKYKGIYDNMPNDLKKRRKFENSMWYSIYDKWRDTDMICISNRDYLLCRDLYISTLIIIIGYILGTTTLNIIEFNWKCIYYLLCMMLVTNISTRLKGKRFVYNVIAYDIRK